MITHPSPRQHQQPLLAASPRLLLTDTCIDGFEWDAYGNGGYAVEHASRQRDGMLVDMEILPLRACEQVHRAP
jgi:hypothetical protein